MHSLNACPHDVKGYQWEGGILKGLIASVTVLNRHLLLKKSLKESFSGNSVKIFDCREFSLFKTRKILGSTVNS